MATIATHDQSYRIVDDMFTAFYPNTTAGQEAWKVIAAQCDGTGKVLHSHVESTIHQLREAGYTVGKTAPPDVSDDELIDALCGADPVANSSAKTPELLIPSLLAVAIATSQNG